MIGRCVANRTSIYIPLKGDTNDYSINNYAVSAFNTPSNTTGIFNESNGAVSFNGSNQYLTFYGAPNSITSGELTFSVYVKKTNTTSLQAINNHRNNAVDNGVNDRKNLLVWMNASGNFEFINKGSTDGAQISKTSQSYSSGQWYHVLTTTNSNSHKFYLDGVLISSYDTTTTGNLELDQGVWQQIARHYYTPGNASGNIYFDGSLCDIRYITKSLSSGEIKILNNEKGRISLPKKLLLDTYTGAAVAYSLRKLRYNYNGSAIRVRRSSDNTEQDIGFVNNQLDVTSLESFCSGTNGFVVTWYDQSGNGNNMVQSTAANQAKIVTSGSVITQNSKPTIDFTSSSGHYYLTNSSVNIGTTISIFVASILEANSGTYQRLINGMDDRYFFVGTDLSEYIATFYGDGGSSWGILTAQTTKTWLNDFRLVTTINNGDDNQYIDGVSSGARSNPMGSFNGKISLGAAFSSSITTSQCFDGKTSELVIYASDQSSNRTGIEGNINTYYGIY